MITLKLNGIEISGTTKAELQAQLATTLEFYPLFKAAINSLVPSVTPKPSQAGEAGENVAAYLAEYNRRANQVGEKTITQYRTPRDHKGMSREQSAETRLAALMAYPENTSLVAFNGTVGKVEGESMDTEPDSELAKGEDDIL